MVMDDERGRDRGGEYGFLAFLKKINLFYINGIDYIWIKSMAFEI